MRWVLAVLAAFALALGGAATVLAAPDLSGTLAPAPTGEGWVEAAPGNSQSLLEGPLDADQLASLDPGAESSVKTALQAHGFAGAYARTWVQQGSERVLLEMVKAFRTPSGASQWYSAAKSGASGTSGASTLDTGQVPNSYGLEGQTSGGAYSSSVVFLKGNDVFHVTIGDPLTPQGTKVVDQAQVAYSYAPEYTIRPPAAGTPFTLGSQLGTARGMTGLLVLVVIPFCGLLFGGLVLWRRERGLAAAGAQMGPSLVEPTRPAPAPPAEPETGPAAGEATAPPPPASPAP